MNSLTWIYTYRVNVLLEAENATISLSDLLPFESGVDEDSENDKQISSDKAPHKRKQTEADDGSQKKKRQKKDEDAEEECPKFCTLSKEDHKKILG
jgi:hypothetical protein